MLCNVADVPELCNFILPAVHREGPIAVAVSTGGASPALAKRLRTQIAELVGPEHAELAEELRALRPEVKERFATYEERRDYFEELVTGAALVTVWLVGAGPGDPGLITARGLDLVRSCEALVYDVLVAPELVAEAPDDALLIPRERHQAGASSTRCSSSSAGRGSRSCASRAATRSSSAAAARRPSRSPRRASRSRSSPASRRCRPSPPRPASRSPTAASRRR